jgi:hypothetical protein
MAGTPREWLYVVQESAWKTAMTTPTAWTTSTTYGLANFGGAYVRLGGPNSWTARSRPVGKVETPYGGGFDVPAYVTSDKQENKGTLTLQLTVGQAPFWLSWWLQRITSGTSPWTTTIPNGDLASCTVYHAVISPTDNTIKRQAHVGMKVMDGTLSVSADSTVVTLTLNLEGAAVQGNPFDSSADPTVTPFPNPVDANFPSDPYVFVHSGGSSYFTYGGAVRTAFTELNLKVSNHFARKWYPASYYIGLLNWMGRKTSVSTRLLYPGSPQTDRTNFIQLTSEACSMEMNNGTHGFTVNMNAQNVLDPLEDDLKLNDVFEQTSTSNNMWDPSAGSDLTLTIT